MPAFSVNIDGRVYEGHYRSRANAVYGAALKDEIDIYRGRGYAQARELLRGPALIGVEEVTDRKVAKKIHRVK